MVSLTDRVGLPQYLAEARKDAYLSALLDFLHGDRVRSRSSGASTADDVSLELLRHIQGRDMAGFEVAVQNISSRRVTPDADWLFNDLLLLSLTIGYCLFSLDDSWLCETLRVRQESCQGEGREVAVALNAAIGRRPPNQATHTVIHLAVAEAVGAGYPDARALNDVLVLVLESFPPFRSPVLNILAVRAVEATLALKDIDGVGVDRQLKAFAVDFSTRCLASGHAVWVTLVAITSLLLVWLSALYVVSESPVLGRLWDVLVGLAGATVFTSLLRAKARLVQAFGVTVASMFGGGSILKRFEAPCTLGRPTLPGPAGR
jgi:hypothetical protein